LCHGVEWSAARAQLKTNKFQLSWCEVCVIIQNEALQSIAINLAECEQLFEFDFMASR
jgi:hypothetical protein